MHIYIVFSVLLRGIHWTMEEQQTQKKHIEQVLQNKTVS